MKSLIDIISKKYYSGTIILLSNVYGKTKVSIGDKLNIIAEFFSEEEFEYILNALKQCKYNVVCYFDENEFISDYLNASIRANDYLVFNLARNGYGVGKKSLIPTFCDLNNIKYTASNGYACSIARNKYHVNALLQYLGLNSLESYVFNGNWLNEKSPNFSNNKKFIIKPLFESASQGVSGKSIYDSSTNGNIGKFVEDTFYRLNESPLIVQQFIEGYEAKITIIDWEKPYALPPVGVQINDAKNLGSSIISDEIAFDYKHENYLLNRVFGNKFIDNICKDALKVYNALGMQNYGRIDCRIDTASNEVYFMDFSTMPYFVSGGEMLFAFQSMGKDIHGLLNSIINSALYSKYHITPDNT